MPEVQASDDAADRVAYARDLWPRHHLAVRAGNVAEHRPAGIVWPRDTADVARIVRWAGETGTPIVPFGAGTSLGAALWIDRQRRLWVLDHGHYGFGHPRITAYDLDSGREVHRYDFPSEVAGMFSMLNDFQVDLAGQHIYIADASPIIQRPALIVYDVVREHAQRRQLAAAEPVVSTPASGWVSSPATAPASADEPR
jgi:hypothetical protein